METKDLLNMIRDFLDSKNLKISPIMYDPDKLENKTPLYVMEENETDMYKSFIVTVENIKKN